jgi:hypothetical protein
MGMVSGPARTASCTDELAISCPMSLSDTL